METIKDILFFLNEIDYIEKVNGDIIENFKHVKLRLVMILQIMTDLDYYRF